MESTVRRGEISRLLPIIDCQAVVAVNWTTAIQAGDDFTLIVMISTHQQQTPSTSGIQPLPFSWIVCVLSLVCLGLTLAIHRIKHRRKPYTFTTHPDPWSISEMEKATPSMDSKICPPPSACDLLEPRSKDSGPNSGEIAAEVRAQSGNAADPTEPSKTTAASSKDDDGGGIETHSSVQKRRESVQQMHDDDAEGVRTWRRVIVEYS